MGDEREPQASASDQPDETPVDAPAQVGPGGDAEPQVDAVDHAELADGAVVLERPVRESTGDQVVDEVLEQFDRVTGEPLATHIEAAERIHGTLQSRLSDLGDG